MARKRTARPEERPAPLSQRRRRSDTDATHTTAPPRSTRSVPTPLFPAQQRTSGPVLREVHQRKLRRAAESRTPASGQRLTNLEHDAEAGFERLFVRVIWRLGLVAQKDIRNLTQRIEALERRLKARSTPHRLKTVPRKPPTPSSSNGDSSASGGSAA